MFLLLWLVFSCTSPIFSQIRHYHHRYDCIQKDILVNSIAIFFLLILLSSSSLARSENVVVFTDLVLVIFVVVAGIVLMLICLLFSPPVSTTAAAAADDVEDDDDDVDNAWMNLTSLLLLVKEIIPIILIKKIRNRLFQNRVDDSIDRFIFFFCCCLLVVYNVVTFHFMCFCIAREVIDREAKRSKE